MMRFAFSALVIAISLISDPAYSSAIQRVQASFVPAPDGIRFTSLPLEVLAASPLIAFPSRKEVHRCSSAVVSDDGNLLTAGHCLFNCLSDNDAMVEQSRFDSANFLLREIKMPAKSKRLIVCEGILNGKKTKFEVLSARGCLIEGSSEGGSEGELFAKARSYCVKQPDYALLRPMVALKRPLPCFEVGYADKDSREKVLIIGYPGPTVRKKLDERAIDADGQSQYVSFGSIVDSEVCTRADSGETFGLRDKMGDGYMRIVADVVPGFSGGPIVLRYSGKIVGIIDDTAGSTAHECDLSFGQTLSDIARLLLEEGKTGEQINGLFSCQKNSAMKGVLR